ncbi:MAG: GMC family oxidoreductase [Corynebacterium sp.]|uniref:GMC family oxidoreductase n=1 Tax=Corynebacterium sp. TaxID=1720 RepID=UPI003F9AFA32
MADSDTTDFLVIGAGSAGNVLTRRLLDAGHTVTLVEAGGQDTNPDIDTLNTLGLLWHSGEDWDYWSTPQKGAHDRRIHVPRGKVMGGSHALNAAIWVRGSKADYDAWAYLGCDGWGWEDVLPFFRRIEAFDGGDSTLRGGDGPLDVRGNYPHAPVQDSIIEAAQQAGFPLNGDYNSGDPEGVSRMQLNLRDGERFNTWRAYLKPVSDSERLTILTGAHVHRVLLDGSQVTGAEVSVDGTRRTLSASTVVLCAGALGSPEILLRSGIGPASELREVGVGPVHDVPGVGRNLQDHFLSPVIYTTDGDHPIEVSPAAPCESHMWARSAPDKALPDTQPIFFSVPMYSQNYGPGDGGEEMTGPESGFSLLGGLVRTASRGSVTLTGPGEDSPIAVDLGALTEQADVDALVESVRHCRSIGRQDALTQWGATEIWPGPGVPDDDREALENYVRDSVVTYHHQVGTCAMGTGPDAVVDPRTLAVRGLTGLHIADASVMPLIPTGNTNAPSVMIGERAAEMLA